MKAIRKVILPNGNKATEIEYKNIGGSETTFNYQYRRFFLFLNKKNFETDYWGRIEGIKIL